MLEKVGRIEERELLLCFIVTLKGLKLDSNKFKLLTASLNDFKEKSDFLGVSYIFTKCLPPHNII